VGGDGIQARREASMPGDTRPDCGACVERTQTVAKAWLPDEKHCYLTILPQRGVYLLLCSRGGLVIFPTRRDFIYIAIGFQARFSSQFCREHDLWLYGSIHGCVDFLLLA
jgi:hypothetical protein